MFGAILYVVLVVLSEGDALDLLDAVPQGADSKRARK